MLWDIILLDQDTVVILYLNKQLINFIMRRTTYWTKSILLEDYTTCNIFYFSAITKFANVKLSGYFFSIVN